MPSVQTTPKRPPAKPARAILVYHNDGKKVLVEGIPGNAKVTFGQVQPGVHGYGQNALRIYTAESNQLAVFCDVQSFRDLMLTVKEQVVHRRLKDNAVSGPNGNYGDSEYEVEYFWDEVALDAPPDTTVDRKKNGGNPFNQF